MTTKSSRIMTIREAARACNRSPETVRRWVWGGKIQAQKLGNQLFVKRSDIAAIGCVGGKDTMASQGDFIERARIGRERIRQRLGGNLNVLELLDESREGHP